jgi:general secretion pathway protein N
MTSFFDSIGSSPPPRRAKLSRPRRFGKSGFAESTLQELAWQRKRSAGLRWAIAGGIVGSLLGLVLFAPAAWLARAVASASDDRVLLTDARGTVWNGDAVAVLTGGADSRSASSLPGRLSWTLRPAWMALNLRVQHACCINNAATLRVQPGLGRTVMTMLPPSGSTNVGQWPAGWLAGLGTPWNTLQLGGTVRMTSPGFTVERVQGRMRFVGEAAVDLSSVSSRLSTLPTLGSYRVQWRGDAANGGTPTIDVTTLQGPLQLKGQGQWVGTGLRFRGEASGSEGQEEALSNLLNIIGRRRGAVSVISIG